MPKHLILAGSGHATRPASKNLKEFISRGHRVTLVGPSSHHYYYRMGPGMPAQTYRPKEIRFNIQKMAQAEGGSVPKGTVEEVKPVGNVWS